MARWNRGEAEVEALIASGDLQQLTGEAATGQRLVEKAAVTLETARSAVERDPDSAFVLAYAAARQALTGLLAQQGLRPTTKGGHYAVEQAVRAQFGSGFRQFGALRRRRNELEYPARPGPRNAAAVEVAACDRSSHRVPRTSRRAGWSPTASGILRARC